MLVESIVLLSAILGLALAISAFVFHAMTRKTERKSEEELAHTLNTAIEDALEEINQTVQSALDELKTRHQETLFYYQMLQEKQEAPAAASAPVPVVMEKGFDVVVNEPIRWDALIEPEAEPETVPPVAAIELAPVESYESTHPHHDEIMALHAQGVDVVDIARQLGMGHGAVQLIINFAGATGTGGR